MDNFYPRVMKKWKLPNNITGAVSFPVKGPTVFFRNDEYYLYDDKKVKPMEGFPQKISNLFSICDDS
jgi:Hemopexin